MHPAVNSFPPSRDTPAVRCGETRREVLIVFTRYPQPGRTKTRLIPALGPDGAARLHDELTRHAVTAVLGSTRRRHRRLVIRHDGGTRREMRAWLGRSFDYQPQSTGDLGTRLDQAATDAFKNGASSVVMMGSDCPGLNSAVVDDAFSALERRPLVLGPATDGGYYLIGMRAPQPELFRGIAWGTPKVLRETLAAAKRTGLDARLLPELADVDEPSDLPAWENAFRSARAISVIVPTLNESGQIVQTLRSVQAGGVAPSEIIVADGGSRDETVELARRAGAKVVLGPRSRARQMNAGAAVARGGILLFLHADTELPPGWMADLHAGLAKPDLVGGAFAFSIREPFFGRRLVEWTANLRSSLGRMPYGDQGIFVRRWVFEHLGGYPDQPLMEDYEFVRRLRRVGRIVALPAAVRTSGRRWLKFGVMRVTLINKLVILGYRTGVSPDRLASFYRRPQNDPSCSRSR